MILVFLISIIVVTLVYEIYVSGKHPILPASISESYYILEENRKGSGIWFSVYCITLASLLMYPFLELSSTPAQEGLAFLTSVSLLFVAASPLFRDSFVGKVHYSSAIIMVVASQLWMMLGDSYYVIISGLVTAGLMTLITGKRCWMYNLEISLLLVTVFKLITLAVS